MNKHQSLLNEHQKGMDQKVEWSREIDDLIDHVVNLTRNKKPVTELLSNSTAVKLAGLLRTELLRITKEESAWTLLVFLFILQDFQQGNKTRLAQLYKKISYGSMGNYMINLALINLKVLDIVVEKQKRKRIPDNLTYYLEPDMVNLLMDQSPLRDFEEQEIFGHKIYQYITRVKGFHYRFNTTDVRKKLDHIMWQYRDLDLVQKIRSVDEIKETEKYILLMTTAHHLCQAFRLLEPHLKIIADQREIDRLIDKFYKGKSMLIEKKWIEVRPHNPLKLAEFSLTPKGKRVLGLYHQKTPSERSGGDSRPDDFIMKELKPEPEFFTSITHDNIEKEELFFNDHIDSTLTMYSRLFAKEDDILIKNLSFSRKMLFMFEGAPGTGKTAAAFQLAKMSNRDLIHVNWQTFRGQFVGQSEKNLKNLVHELDQLSKNNQRVPIVLFNEAEAFLSARVRISQSTDRMENNLVSLLLEWMERKDPLGIIIFTSNHLNLVDVAFERRIDALKFEAPGHQTRIKMWQTMNNRHKLNLETDKIIELAQYAVSGAEIVNTIRKYQMHQVAFDDDKVNFQLLSHLVNKQKWLNTSRPIGFKKVSE